MIRAFASSCLLVAIATLASAEPEKPKLPDGVAALVRGEAISMAEFEAALVRRYRDVEQGKKAIDELVERIVVEAEADEKGVEVDDDDVEDYEEKIEKDVVRVSGGTKTLDDLLAEKGVSREEFRRVSRDFLLRQRLAAEYLDVEGDVSAAQLAVWLDDLKKRRGARVGGPDLPAGVVAMAGGRMVTTADLGRSLLTSLTPADLESALWDLVIARLVQQDLDAAKIRIEPADIELSLADLKDEFTEDPRFRQTTFTFDQYVQAVRHLTIEELKRDPLFLAQVGLAKKIRTLLTEDEIRAYFDLHRERYGEHRTFIHLVIKADDRAEPFGKTATRSYAEAKEIIDSLYARYLRGTAFEKLVNDSSEDRSNYSRPDRPIRVNRETPLPDELREKVFSAPPGEVVGPVRTPYGWHLLKVTEVSAARGYEEAKAEVRRDIVRDTRTRALLELRQDKNVILRY